MNNRRNQLTKKSIQKINFQPFTRGKIKYLKDTKQNPRKVVKTTKTTENYVSFLLVSACQP